LRSAFGALVGSAGQNTHFASSDINVSLLIRLSPATECETILSVIGSSNGDVPVENQITTSTQFLTAVVSSAIGGIAADSTTATVKTSIFRYFNGSNGYPNILNNPTLANNLVGKLISWFGGYLGCTDSVPAPYSGAQLNLTASHAALKISVSDAKLFNTRVMNAIVTVLVGQNVTLSTPVLQLAGNVSADLDALIPTYAVAPTGLCDKYANIVASAGFGYTLGTENYGVVDYTQLFGTAALNTEYQTNIAARGPGYAFWFYFVKNAVVLGELVGNSTVNAQLGKYFNGSKGTANFFANGGNNANLATLINKLVAWFGQATACSDAEFLSFATATGAVASGQPINLSASHQGLQISAADSALFNTAITRQAVAALNPLGLTSGEATAVVNLLSSVNTQVIYQPPAAPVGSAPTAPLSPVAATAPKSAGAAVVASFGLVGASLIALLL
jgi:hypothetical protein